MTEKQTSTALAATAIAVLVIIASLAAWSGMQPVSAPTAFRAERVEEPTASGPTVVEKADDKIARYTEWLAILTGGLVLVSAVQIWFLIQADRTAQKTAGAALKAAEATESSVEVARSALRDTERPFVYLKTVEVLVEKGPSTAGMGTAIEFEEARPVIGFTFTPLWGNSGRTPARRILTYSSIKRFGPQLPANVHFDENVIPQSGVLGPNAEMYTIGSKINSGDIRKLSNREMTMLIMGWADYDDVFPGTPRHRTEFCLQIKIIPEVDGKVRVVLPTYSRLNGFDDECQNKPKPYYPPPLVG